MKFKPDYTHVLNAAKNIEAKRTPLYEHIIEPKFIEKAINKDFVNLINGDRKDKTEFFKHFCSFFKDMGYDTVSFQVGYDEAMPGSGALRNNTPGIIKTRDDYEKYPWEQIPNTFKNMAYEQFEILGEVMPEGMLAVGGPGFGIFQAVEDLVGYEELCYMSVDDPELYRELFDKIFSIYYSIWKEFLERFANSFVVCRFGDDLGFGSNTLISAKDIKEIIIPMYARIIKLIHSYKKPFLLHSCGKIFDVMDDLIDIAKIDSKHSNEDNIAPFTTWVDKYGDKIGNFGGMDVGVLCSESSAEIKIRTKAILEYCVGKGGFAFGVGNSLTDYVPVDNYFVMIEEANKFREMQVKQNN